MLVVAQCANDFPIVTVPSFTITSGPCSVLNDGHCVERGSYTNNEHCQITVDGPGTLGPCPRFDTESASYDYLTINNHRYGGHAKSSCPEGVEVNEGTTISWRTDGSAVRTGWEICFCLRVTIEEMLLTELQLQLCHPSGCEQIFLSFHKSSSGFSCTFP